MDTESSKSPTEERNTDSATATPPRRGFLVSFLAGAIGLIVGLVPFLTGALFFLDPLIRKKGANPAEPGGVEKDPDGFVNLTVTLDALPEDGTPQAFKVYDDKVDAWNKFLNVEVGTVWLRRTKEGEVIAFHSICPHLGCSVDYRAALGNFYCPCHQSTFNLDGEKMNQIPPRGMDQLAVKVKQGKMIWLKFENFRGATPEKIAIS